MSLNSEEIKQVEELYQSIIGKASFSLAEKKLVRSAFTFANKAHSEMRRKNGIPYIYHPLEVAQICYEDIGLDATSLCCAFLHDVVEDTEFTYQDIKKKFGVEIADIVEGLTKIPKNFFTKESDDDEQQINSDGIAQEEITQQIANFQKLLSTFKSDIRVILIKIADRLHNMRTLDSMKRMNQIKTSSETHLFYAPLAQSLGLYEIKSELDNLSLKYRYPKVYDDLNAKIARKENSRKRYISTFLAPIEKALKENSINYRVETKARSVASVWEKMESKQLSIDDVYENYTLKIIFKPESNANEMHIVNTCYKIYICTALVYKPKPNALKDYINQPKSNGYKALHMVFMGQEGKWVEIQAMSEEMYQISIKGFAAEQIFNKENYAHRLQDFITKLESATSGLDEDPHKGITQFRSTFFSPEIIVFTYKGQPVRMPGNSTILDFAYDRRTDLGHHCISAKVNQSSVGINYVLKGGDKIEILTIKEIQVKEDWLNIVVTPKAKQEIIHYIGDERKKTIQNGLAIFKEIADSYHVANQKEILQNVIYYTNYNSEEDILYSIGKKTVDIEFLKENILKAVIGLKNIEQQVKEEASFFTSKSITINNIELYDFISLGKCCDPIPGDELIGVKKSKRIIIHQASCPTAIRTMAQASEQTVEVIWKSSSSENSSSFKADLQMEGMDRLGLMHDLTKTISFDANINMRSLQFSTDNALFKGHISLYINSKESLNHLINKLLDIKGVEKVKRVYDETLNTIAQ